MRIDRPEQKRIRLLVMIPLLSAILLNAVSVLTGWVYTIDAEGSFRLGTLFWVQTVVCQSYLLIPTILSLRKAFSIRIWAEKSEYLIYAAYMLPAVLAAFTEDFIPSVPVLSLSMFMVINILFMTIQDRQIYNDALTGLNNRRRLEGYLSERLGDVSEKNPICLFMIDVDRFKAINDTYGHTEGDDALKTVADVLKITASRYGAFVARYGGDEFCMIGCSAPAEEVIDEIRNTLARRSKMAGSQKGYNLSVSIGCCICTSPDKKTIEVIREADAKLYADKRMKEKRWEG